MLSVVFDCSFVRMYGSAYQVSCMYGRTISFCLPREGLHSLSYPRAISKQFNVAWRAPCHSLLFSMYLRRYLVFLFCRCS